MKYFGTDGIRGVPFNFPFTYDFLVKIGYSIAKKLSDNKKSVYIATDTRKSGKKIVELLSKGMISFGFKVYNLGVITTPSLSYILNKKRPSFGIMVSASHNPPEFNGIKVLNSRGEKISDKKEQEIERLLDSDIKIKEKTVNEITSYNFIDEYTNYVISNFIGKINDLKIVVDCSNGAAYKIAPYIFKKLKTSFTLIGDKPNGENINLGCGALETDMMRKMVLKTNAFCGISYDGDCDRCIISDEKGNIIDGDDIIAVLSLYYKKTKTLKNNTVVLTHMSNYGLVRFLSDNGIKVVIVDVGDRNVSRAMVLNGAFLGGETSGHIVIRKYLSTGDGIITSLEMIKAIRELGMKFSDVRKLWNRYPSYLKSYKVESKPSLLKLDGFQSYLKNIEKNINGRVFVRYSGTEPVLRVLVEADRGREQLKKIADDIFDFYLSKSMNCSL